MNFVALAFFMPEVHLENSPIEEKLWGRMRVAYAGASTGGRMNLGYYSAFLQDLFAGLGTLEMRPMFGVTGLFLDGTMFAVVANERIFLKTDESSRGHFVREDAAPFVYRVRDGSEIVTSYYELPARLFDDPDEAAAWARHAYEIALRSPTSKRKRRKRSKLKPPRQPPRRLRRS